MPKILRRGRHLAWRRLDGETVVVDSRGRRIYGLNEAGGFLWHRLDQPRTFADLAALLPAAAADVRRFVDELLAVGLIEDDGGTVPQPPPLRRVGGAEAQASAAPPPDDPVPVLLWQDEIRRFAQSCAFSPLEPGPCQSFPFS